MRLLLRCIHADPSGLGEAIGTTFPVGDDADHPGLDADGRLVLTAGATIAIGRMSHCSIWIHNGFVSGHRHCWIRVADDGSARIFAGGHGCGRSPRKNGAPVVREAPLSPGDRVDVLTEHEPPRLVARFVIESDPDP